MLTDQKQQLADKGYVIVEDIFLKHEITAIIHAIDQADSSGEAFRKTGDLFAIRRFLQEVPAVQSLIFTERLRRLMQDFFDGSYFAIRSIYFDKPEQSNWFVAWHQDLTINVDNKNVHQDFQRWSSKQNYYSVQPPLSILQNIFTIRIHLDDTDENNGTLKVVPGSHLKGIYRPETIDWTKETEESCNVKKGGAMIMRPLLLHASGRTTDDRKRRVIHIEFCNAQLPEGIKWAEALYL